MININCYVSINKQKYNILNDFCQIMNAKLISEEMNKRIVAKQKVNPKDAWILAIKIIYEDK